MSVHRHTAVLLSSLALLLLPPPLQPNVGQDLLKLTREVVFADRALGSITDVQLVKDGPAGAEQLAVAGTRGVAFLDARTHALERRLLFSLPDQLPDKIRIVYPSDPGQTWFLRTDASAEPIMLIGPDGVPVWAMGHRTAAIGDFDSDGEPEFAMRYKRRNGTSLKTGVQMVARDGAVRWEVPLPVVYRICAADTDSNGSEEILALSAGPECRLTVIDGTGSVVGRTTFPRGTFGYVSDMAVVGPIAGQRGPLLVVRGDGDRRYGLVRMDGKTVVRWLAPSLYMDPVRATWVRFRPGEKHLALLGTVIAAQANVPVPRLCIYDGDGQLAYEETFSVSAARGAVALLAVEDRDGGEALLVGGEADGSLRRLSLPKVER